MKVLKVIVDGGTLAALSIASGCWSKGVFIGDMQSFYVIDCKMLDYKILSSSVDQKDVTGRTIGVWVADFYFQMYIK